MPESPLRGPILRLARQDPELRPELVRILREAGELTDRDAHDLLQPLTAPSDAAQSPVVVNIINNQNQGDSESEIEGAEAAPAVPAPPAAATPALSPNESPIGVPEALAPEAPVSALFVPERAQQGFNVELLPEMEKMLAAGTPRAQVAQQIAALLASSFAKKDSLYNILIRYQSSFEGNEEYQGNLESLIEAWATSNSGA